MSNLIPVKHNNQLILTTEQIAELYEVGHMKITQNFNNNKNRYEAGKHYFCLKGEELKRFRSEIEIFDIAENVHTFYLWTERGALLHAKSLNTDRAWERYEYLIDHYFRTREAGLSKTQPPKPAPPKLTGAPLFVKRLFIRGGGMCVCGKTQPVPVMPYRDFTEITGIQEKQIRKALGQLNRNRETALKGGVDWNVMLPNTREQFNEMYGTDYKSDDEAGYLGYWYRSGLLKVIEVLPVSPQAREDLLRLMPPEASAQRIQAKPKEYKITGTFTIAV